MGSPCGWGQVVQVPRAARSSLSRSGGADQKDGGCLLHTGDLLSGPWTPGSCPGPFPGHSAPAWQPLASACCPLCLLCPCPYVLMSLDALGLCLPPWGWDPTSGGRRLACRSGQVLAGR